MLSSSSSTRPRLGQRVAAATALAVLLVACSSADEPESSSDSDAATTTADTAGGSASSAPDAFPVTIEHKYGETTIEAPPERVVSVGFADQDPILALGVVPVGIRDWYGDQPFATWPWASSALGDAEPEVLAADELNFEQISALEPDLIIGLSSGMSDTEYDTLSQIAPTLPQSGEYIDYGMPWQESMLVIGEALGRAEEAQAMVADVEGQIAAAAATQGREIFMGQLQAGAFSFGSVLSLPYLLETFVPQLEAAVDGDPATEVPTAA